MIETQTQYKEQESLTKEITEFKKINASLKKKIQARDKKITYLLSCMQPGAKMQTHNLVESNSLKKNSSEIQSVSQVRKQTCLTEPRNKQKQNFANQNKRCRNPESAELKISLKLPTLDRKNIFAEDIENTDARPRIIKISLQKLIPLKAEEVKKKFENKFK